jgi:hypothetical protein
MNVNYDNMPDNHRKLIESAVDLAESHSGNTLQNYRGLLIQLEKIRSHIDKNPQMVFTFELSGAEKLFDSIEKKIKVIITNIEELDRLFK